MFLNTLITPTAMLGYCSQIIPFKLFNKLRSLNVNPQMCKWSLDFLFNRTQMVKVNTPLSEPLTLSTGAPQGFVLSPLLFTLFTNDCRSNSNSVLILKFSDDTPVEGLITNTDSQLKGWRLSGWLTGVSVMTWS